MNQSASSVSSRASGAWNVTPAACFTTGAIAWMSAVRWAQPRWRPRRSLTARVNPRGHREADERLQRRHRLRADPVRVSLHAASNLDDDEVGVADAQRDLHLVD